MKISLGSAQFGLNYGTFNQYGQTPVKEVKKILSLAKSYGIEYIDTARGYGESEEIIGKLSAPANFEIITKCPNLQKADNPVTKLQEEFAKSKLALGVASVYGYLLHNASDILLPGVYSALQDLRNNGAVKKIGVSEYSVLDATKYCNRFDLDLVQLPGNVLDPWYNNNDLPNHIEIHVRSVLLQGFLLAEPNSLPNFLKRFSPVLEQFKADAEKQGVTQIQAAILPLIKCASISKIIIGVVSEPQLAEILVAMEHRNDIQELRFGPYKDVTAELIDPRLWLSS